MNVIQLMTECLSEIQNVVSKTEAKEVTIEVDTILTCVTKMRSALAAMNDGVPTGTNFKYHR